MGEGVVIVAKSGGETTGYLYGLERIAALNGKNKTEYAYDGRGSVAAELRYTDAWYTLGGALSKANVTSRSYTPFGEQIGEALSGFGYNGEYYNANTGMIYLRARFYEPEMNRFSQKDILWGDITVPNSLNRYAYVQNDPVNFCDPSGMRQVKGVDASGTSGSTYSVKKTTSSAAAAKASNATKMAYMYSNEARMTGSAAAAKKATQATSMAYSYANEARMNGNRSSVYNTYGALQAANTQLSYTNSRTPSTVASTSPKATSPVKEGSCNLVNASSMTSSLSSFAYGLYHTLNNALFRSEAKYLVEEASNWIKIQAYDSNIIGNLEKAAKLNSAASRASALSGLAAVAGMGVDLAIQLLSNDSASLAVTKTITHAALGYVGGAVAAAIATSSIAVTALPVIAIGSAIAISVLLPMAVDYALDKVEEDTGFFSKLDSKISAFFSR